MNDVYYFSHGGPGSGRYPLGSGDRPYQKFEGSGGKGGISGYIRSIKIKKAEAKIEKQKAEKQKRQLEEIEERKKLAADKERVLREGKASEVKKYYGQLTNSELRDVSDRLRLERQINGYSEQETKAALDYLKKIESYTKVGSELTKNGIELWNSFVSVYNVTENGKKNPLSFVGRGDGGKKK